MKGRHAEAWEELARREPYFTVLDHEGCRGVDGNRFASAAFFETGEADISSLLSAIAVLCGGDIPLTSCLDFGCGAGRLTLPLARRATRVVACDLAPTMLTHARRNAEDAGLGNVTFMENDELAGLPDGRFEFVCSLLVLQYIPPAAGYAIIRTLLRLLAPAGIAALHVAFERRGGRLHRLARMHRRTSRFARRGAGLNPIRIHEYDERVVHRQIEVAGAHVIGRFPTRDGEMAGAVLIVRNSPHQAE